MRKGLIFPGLIVSVILIVLSLVVPVNVSFGSGGLLVADGIPLPPPPKGSGGFLVADGIPLPPPPPGSGSVLVAV